MSHTVRRISGREFLSPETAIIDDWVRSVPDPGLRDRLLELRAACSDLQRNPTGVVRRFLKLRPRLSRSSYLEQYRLRRALEARLAIEITTPERTWTQPLRLSWRTLGQTLGEARREVFERTDHDWDRIRVRIIAQALSSLHGQDPL